jgi:hypothetical protein
MVEMAHRIDGDRVIITLDPGQPIELTDLSSSFAALARIYERHYRTSGDAAPKLYVTKLETGSVILEIAPLVFAMGMPILDNTIIVADFAGRLWRGLKAFSGVAGEPPRLEAPPPDDAADLREFIRPLTGKMGATLGIKHAKYEKEDGVRRTVVEYDFDEAQINRAAINIDEQKRLPPPTEEELPSVSALHTEVMLFLEQANRGPGKEKGRTGDRGVIPDISDKVVPVYFRKGIQGLKDQMLHGDRNPFEMVYVVTVHVTRLDGDVQAYTVADIHDSFSRPE